MSLMSLIKDVRSVFPSLIKPKRNLPTIFRVKNIGLDDDTDSDVTTIRQTANNVFVISTTAVNSTSAPHFTPQITSNAVTAPSSGTIFTSVATSLFNTQDLDDYYNLPLVRDALKLMGECTVEDGESCNIKLPDGSIIEVNKDGSFKINDKDAKLIYRANRIREFNRYLNASDLLEKFIKFCGEQGVRKDQMLHLPINLFIGWLVIEAAQADGEETPDVPLLEDLSKWSSKGVQVPDQMAFDFT